MMVRSLTAASLLAAVLVTAPAAETKNAAEKKALQEVADFAGQWKGNGETKSNGRSQFWKETLNWGWRFKDGEAWIALEVNGGKFLTGGQLRYDPATKLYRLTATDKAKKEHVYEGKLTRGRLVLTHKDAGTGDVHRLTVYTLADGARMIVQSEVQPKGRGLFDTQFKVAATNAAESFAGGGKKPECVVTGGLGTMSVSYNGKTYYVCCSGCREEFNANPKKYVEEYEKRKNK